MSVIFKALKKLKTESSVAGKNTARRENKNKTIPFDATLRVSSAILLLLVLFTVIGTGSLFGYFQFRETSSKKVEAFSVLNTDMRQSTKISFNGKPEDKGNSRFDSSTSPALNSIEYRPPAANENDIDMKDLVPSTGVNVRIASKRKPNETSRIESKIQAKETGKSLTSKDSAASDVKKVFLANARRNAQIARLITNIRKEMDHGDSVRIRKLFDELAMILGPDNTYVLKLKAVWHIRNQEYEEAVSLLKTVLSKNELDLEAGLNMAIIEIKTRKEQNAYRRLEKLQKSYPDNIRLAEILQDLRRLFGEEQLGHYSKHNG
jgi:hypothetical protein